MWGPGNDMHSEDLYPIGMFILLNVQYIAQDARRQYAVFSLGPFARGCLQSLIIAACIGLCDVAFHLRITKSNQAGRLARLFPILDQAWCPRSAVRSSGTSGISWVRNITYRSAGRSIIIKVIHDIPLTAYLYSLCMASRQAATTETARNLQLFPNPDIAECGCMNMIMIIPRMEEELALYMWAPL